MGRAFSYERGTPVTRRALSYSPQNADLCTLNPESSSLGPRFSSFISLLEATLTQHNLEATLTQLGGNVDCTQCRGNVQRWLQKTVSGTATERGGHNLKGSLSPESLGQNLALTVFHVPYSLDSGNRPWISYCPGTKPAPFTQLILFFSFFLVTVPCSSLSLKLSDTRVYELNLPGSLIRSKCYREHFWTGIGSVSSIEIYLPNHITAFAF